MKNEAIGETILLCPIIKLITVNLKIKGYLKCIFIERLQTSSNICFLVSPVFFRRPKMNRMKTLVV